MMMAVLSNPELSATMLKTYGIQYADLYKAVMIDYQGGYGGVVTFMTIFTPIPFRF